MNESAGKELKHVARASPPVLDGWNWQDFRLTGRMPVPHRSVDPIRTTPVAACCLLPMA